MAPYPLLKRVTDKVVAALIIALIAPLALVVVSAMALDMLLVSDDRGPFLYRERRLSRGREFDLLKLRMLRTDVLATVNTNSYIRTVEADPANLTHAGRVLKRWYLDELPQLVNILKGDMSLVGPRPWPIAMVEEQAASGYSYRNLIQAGWTGPAQITKGTTNPVRYQTLDLAYLEACRTLKPTRLWLYDLRILAQTALTILRGQGLQN